MYRHLPLDKIILLLAIDVILTIVALLYTLTLRRTLLGISPQNRKINANIPFLPLGLSTTGVLFLALFSQPAGAITALISLIIQIFIIRLIHRSLDAEFTMREIAINRKPVYISGALFILFGILSIILSKTTGPLSPKLSFIFDVAGYILWIVYWVGITTLKNKLKRAPVFEPGSSEIFS